MPRGGKRPGAGAPRGNLNGLRTGMHTPRMLLVYRVIIKHPDRKALAHELYHAGFFPPPRYRFNQNVGGITDYLYRRWFEGFEGMHEIAINCNQTHRRTIPYGLPRPASTPPADTANKP